jgi:hypothetical protein
LYKNFLKRPEIVDEVPYPKQEKYIPEIFTGIELKRMFDNIRNVKHRVMLKLIYSCGLPANIARGNPQVPCRYSPRLKLGRRYSETLEYRSMARRAAKCPFRWTCRGVSSPHPGAGRLREK